MAKHFFSNIEGLRELYGRLYKETFSKHFFDFMDRKIVSIIKKETGLSPSPQFTFGFGHLYEATELYSPGVISVLKLSIGIASVVGHNVSFCWRSKTGNIVRIDQEEFDEDDIECWMEGLTPDQYYADLALYTNKKPPFKMKNLPFDLEIRDYAYTMELMVTIPDGFAFDAMNEEIDNIIVKHNEIAEEYARDESKDSQLLAVHNWKISKLDGEKLNIYLDAASPEILKKIVKGLTKYPSVTKVEMDLPSYLDN